MIELNRPEDLIAAMGIPFSDEQIEAITAPMAPGVIIAGAGTGKTTVMTARVVWLVGRGEVAPERVLGLTFTRKAAGELSGRVRAALRLVDDEPERYPEISTYDSFAARLVNEFGAWEGIGQDVRLLSDAERYLLADLVVTSQSDPPVHLSDRALSTIETDLLSLEGRIQSHLVPDQVIVDDAARFVGALDQAPLYRGSPYRSVVDARRTVLERLDLLQLCQKYRDVKTSRSVVEFSDQMALAVDLAGHLPHLGQIMRGRYGLVVVDEYQDTSAAQARLLSRLFGAEGGIEGYPITAVGDPLQAIYTWRGAAVDNIYSFHRHFPPPGSQTPTDEDWGRGERIHTAGAQEADGARGGEYTLSINRRSGPEILAGANAIAEEVRADPLLGSHMAVELIPGPDAVPADLQVREFLTWEEETEWIADSLFQSHLSGMEWEKAAILVRRNREVGALVEACQSRGVPVAIQDLGGLLSIEAVSQIYAMMKLLVDEGSNPEIAEILTGPRFRVAREDLTLLGKRARALVRGDADEDRTVRLIDALRDPGEDRFSSHACASFSRLVSDLAILSAFQGNLVDHVRRIVARIGVDVEIHASQDQASPHVRKFMAHVADFASTHPTVSLDALVAYLRAEEEYSVGLSKANPAIADAVAIMTIHRAKGLEWDQVYLPCVVDGVFPGQRVTDNPLSAPSALPTAVRSDAGALPQIHTVTNQGLASYKKELGEALRLSEDRLAYVGVTRARKRLVVTAHRWGDSTRERARSRYFEILAGLAQRVGRVTFATETDAQTLLAGERTMAVPTPWPTKDDPKWHQAAQAVYAAIEGRTIWQVVDLPEEVRAEIASWDDLIATLSRKAPQVVDVPLPTPLSTSQLLRLSKGQEEFAARLARPLPRPPSRASGIGAQFHAWVEQYFAAPPLVEEHVASGRLGRLCRGFMGSRFASARPCAVEESFVTEVAGHTVSGRIDAVFRAEENPSLVPTGKQVLIVDWKTGRRRGDPRQLAVYARAWAAKTGLSPDEITAGFFYILTGEFVEIDLATVTVPTIRLPGSWDHQAEFPVTMAGFSTMEHPPGREERRQMRG